MASVVREYPGPFMSLVNSKVRVRVRVLRIYPVCIHEINFLQETNVFFRFWLMMNAICQ